jgi:hypothetical protein
MIPKGGALRMNETEILMYLLTRQKDNTTIGVEESELLIALGFTDRNGKMKLFNLLEEFGENIKFMGLVLQLNLANQHWFISLKDNIPKQLNHSLEFILPSRLAATLFSILVLTIKNNSSAQMVDLIDLRKKKNVSDDVNELQQLGWVTTKSNTIILTPKVFYYVNMDDLIAEISKITYEGKTDSANH